MSIKITEELKSYLTEQPHVQRVYFIADGSYSAHAYKKDGKLYTHIIDDSLSPNEGQKKFYEVVAELTRNQILGVAAPKADAESDAEETTV